MSNDEGMTKSEHPTKVNQRDRENSVASLLLLSCVRENLQAACLPLQLRYRGATEATRLRQGYGVVWTDMELFWSERTYDFFKTRVAAQRVPPGHQLQIAVADVA